MKTNWIYDAIAGKRRAWIIPKEMVWIYRNGEIEEGERESEKKRVSKIGF